jgi:hypothetical protein
MNWQSVKTFAAPAQMSRHHKHRLDDGDRGHRSVYQVILDASRTSEELLPTRRHRARDISRKPSPKYIVESIRKSERTVYLASPTGCVICPRVHCSVGPDGSMNACVSEQGSAS